MENQKETELVTELLQALMKDITTIKDRVDGLGKQTPPDYRQDIQSLAQAVDQLRQQVSGPAKPALSLNPKAITEQLNRIEFNSRQHPDYTMSQYVQVGALASGLMAVLLVLMTWTALTWQDERDTYARNYNWANWRLRYLKQADPTYYEKIQAKFTKDADGTGQWIEEQEQADATREAARQAAEQAAALTKQANQLEGKKNQGE